MNAAPGSVFLALEVAGMGGLLIVFGWYLLSYADPRRDDPLVFRKRMLVRRDRVPGWLYRVLTFSGQTEDSVGFITASNVGQGVLAVALGIALIVYSVVKVILGSR
jgi:hypothetical protein